MYRTIFEMGASRIAHPIAACSDDHNTCSRNMKRHSQFSLVLDARFCEVFVFAACYRRHMLTQINAQSAKRTGQRHGVQSETFQYGTQRCTSHPIAQFVSKIEARGFENTVYNQRNISAEINQPSFMLQ